jgi:hypothetical protein
MLAAIACGTLITLTASIAVCLGMNPESTYGSDAVAPYLGVLCGSALAGRMVKHDQKDGRPDLQESARAGAVTGYCMGAIWFLTWCYLRARLDADAVWHQAIARVPFIVWLAWFIAGPIGAYAGTYGARARGMGSLLRFKAFNLAVLIVAMIWASHDSPAATTKLSPGVTVETSAPSADGTIVRLVTCDFRADPSLRLRLYDADSDDVHPGDDRDTEYLGASPAAVFDRLNRHLAGNGRSPRVLINGGFFGADSRWTGFHIAPIVTHGRHQYDVHPYSAKWPDQSATFGVRTGSGAPQFAMLPGDRWSDLSGFETALSGVRPLRIAGKSLPLKPGPGSTTLRCSRTSIAWPDDSSKLYILIVREPDGEAGSIAQKESHRRAIGGWDIHEVQHFWEQRGIANAIQFDSGESTQMITQDDGGRTAWIRSAYQLGKTVGYWRDRPVRLHIPIAPPSADVGGVLNYLYVDGDAR